MNPYWDPLDYEEVYLGLVVRIRVVQLFALLTEAIVVCDGSENISTGSLSITLFVVLGSFAVCTKRLLNLLQDEAAEKSGEPIANVPCINPYLIATFGGLLALLSHLISSPIGLVGLNKFLYDLADYIYVASVGATVSIDVFNGIHSKKTRVA